MNKARKNMTAIALNPRASVVVEACAGSGKTWLLVSRVLRLLLAGAAPSSILAITFTRKAAQEMQERLMQWLEILATASDAEVHDFLSQRAMTDIEIAAALPRARTLFTEVAFATPRIAVSTFHGWFQQLLSAAPIGLGISDKTIADSESSLLEEAWLNLAESLNRDPESPAAQALAGLFAQWGLFSTRTVLWNFIKRRAEWRAYSGGALASGAPTSAAENDADETLIASALAHWQQEWNVDLTRAPVEDWANNVAVETSVRAIVTGVTAAPKMTDAALKWPAKLKAALALKDATEKFLAIRAAFLTQKDEQRKYESSWAEKAGVTDYYQLVCASVKDVVDAMTNQEIFIYNRDALIAGTALLNAYEKLKDDQRAVDFADLEWRTFSLLTHSEHAETMQYRLDSRYRHILLDEFQDTNPIQWQCLTAWLDASIAADSAPTVFMVGDPKQAIYRFRRTDARLFQIAKKYFVENFGAEVCALNHTRRNAPAIVDFVNAVFGAEPLFEGFQHHEADNTASIGGVAVLPAFVVEQVPIEFNSELRNPLTTPREDDAKDRFAAEALALATAIKNTVGRVLIEQAIEHGGSRGATERVAEYRDIMVLFRRRAPVVAFEHALRAARIPYVGAKPGGLMAALEVGDMIALLTFLSAPDDDLALAQVLKSPLFNAGDEILISIRFSEIEGTWWQRIGVLSKRGDCAVLMRDAAQKISIWLLAMDHLPVHDLLDKIYHEADVLAAFRDAAPEPMRAAVIANLNAFMALALAVDSGRYPSLPRFLNELKRFRALPDQDAPDEGAVLEDGENTSDDVGTSGGTGVGTGVGINAVRLMTIHASKGLESPIVFLIDADDVSAKIDAHTVLSDWQPEHTSPRHFSFWATKALQGNRRDHILEEEAKMQARERLNLLYVAATRAKQYFVMSGSARSKSPEAVSWLQRAAAAKTETETEADAAKIFPGDAKRVVERVDEIFAESDQSASKMMKADGGATVPVMIEAQSNVAIGTRSAPQFDDEKRLLGIEIHALLDVRTNATNQTKQAAASGSVEAIRITEKILQAEALQHFFDPRRYVAAFNELEICVAAQGQLGQFDTLRIDRLVEFEDEIWVLDYKTGDVLADENAAQHLAQIEAYCASVASLYPTKKIRGALIDADAKLIVLR